MDIENHIFTDYQMAKRETLKLCLQARLDWLLVGTREICIVHASGQELSSGSQSPCAEWHKAWETAASINK